MGIWNECMPKQNVVNILTLSRFINFENTFLKALQETQNVPISKGASTETDLWWEKKTENVCIHPVSI